MKSGRSGEVGKASEEKREASPRKTFGNCVHCGIDLPERMVLRPLKIVAHNNNMPRGITMFRGRITSRHPFHRLADIAQEGQPVCLHVEA